LQRRNDEVNWRKDVIESMSNSLIKHEKESAEMASKLAMMKNQIMVNDAFKGMRRKYAGVKLSTLKQIPVIVNFNKLFNFFIV
jgi:hypothetical protein